MKKFRVIFATFLLTASFVFSLTLTAHAEIAQSQLKNDLVNHVRKIEQTVYITRTGSKYHHDGCRYLKKSAIPIDKSVADKNYSPCKVCRP